MPAGGRRYVPMQVRVAVTGFNAIGGVMLTLALTALGVLLSGMQVDPVNQGGTGYLDFVLFFNAVLFLFPLAVVLVFLGTRIRRGEHWAWLASLVFWAFVGTTAPLLTWLLPAPLPFAVVPVCCAAGLVALLLTPQARVHCADVED
ncbi:hypothetical protein [Dactylosporangium sp. NPDC005555]|uniref:hypothetical protein n=1 Tax=Dactylosporangium sp. NPDC005555 TaxID=3154889 RepID=UPI0033BDA635